MFRVLYSIIFVILLTTACGSEEEALSEKAKEVEPLSKPPSTERIIEGEKTAVLSEDARSKVDEANKALSTGIDSIDELSSLKETPITDEIQKHKAPVFLAKIEQVMGRVYVQYYPDLVKKKKATEGDELNAQDTIITLRDSQARLVFVDGTEVVMDQKSRLVLRSPTEFFQESGISYYDVQKKTAANTLNVRTGFALIGVKGTQFIVSIEETEEIEADVGTVSLREGELNIKNPDGEDFEHHYFSLKEADPMSEFERYQAEMMGSFETYKRKLMEEFVEYKKEFSLEAGRSLSFNESRVDDKEMDEDIEDLFAYFDSLK